MINIETNFLSNLQIFNICNLISDDLNWIVTEDSWSGRFIHAEHIDNNELRVLVAEVQSLVKQEVEKFTNANLTVETCQLVRWRPGDKLDPPHADCENLDGSPHPYPNRHYSALVYLNDEYTGGQIFFPLQKLEPKTSPGTLVHFKGTKDCLHGVTEITSGIRYTIILFLTDTDRV